MSSDDLRYEQKLAARAAGSTTVTVHPPQVTGAASGDGSEEARYQAKLAARAAAAAAKAEEKAKPAKRSAEALLDEAAKLEAEEKASKAEPVGKRHK